MVERRRPGSVRDAVLDAFATIGTELTVSQVCDHVRQLLGEEVPASSIRSCLNLNTPAEFERVRRGVYRRAAAQ
jgi:hypothetical protein